MNDSNEHQDITVEAIHQPVESVQQDLPVVLSLESLLVAAQIAHDIINETF